MEQPKFPKYVKGQRVRLVKMNGEEDRLPVGSLGTVWHFSDFGDWAQVEVHWDNGSRLMPGLPIDIIEVVNE